MLAERAADQAQLARLRQELSDAQQAHKDQLDVLNNAKQALSDQFKALAGEILAKNADAVSKQQQERLGAVLDPLRERLGEFQKMVKTSYDHENRERISCKNS